MAGSRIYTPVRLTIRKQWAGIDGAPETQALSVHKNFGERCTTCDAVGNPLARRSTQRGLGMGAYVFNDKYGAISTYWDRIILCLSSRIQSPVLWEKRYSLIFWFGWYFLSIQIRWRLIFRLEILYTQVLILVSYIPDANFGVYLYNSRLFCRLLNSSSFRIVC